MRTSVSSLKMGIIVAADYVMNTSLMIVKITQRYSQCVSVFGLFTRLTQSTVSYSHIINIYLPSLDDYIRYYRPTYEIGYILEYDRSGTLDRSLDRCSLRECSFLDLVVKFRLKLHSY